MRVLVCGGRDFSDTTCLRVILDELHRKHVFSLVIHGGARGADELAGWWAEGAGLQPLVFKADWKKFGRRAGPIRNQRMLDEGRPDLVVAFPGGSGTADMVRRAGVTKLTIVSIVCPRKASS